MRRLPYGMGDIDWDRLEAARKRQEADKTVIDYTDEGLLKRLQEVAEDLGETPTCHQMKQYPYTASPATYKSHFGSWNNAIEECGLDPNKPGITVDEHRKEQLLAKIQQLSKEIDRDGAPTAREMDRWSRTDSSFPCQSTVRNVFGSWREGVLKAGFSPHSQGKGPKKTARKEGIDYIPIGRGWYKQREKAIERDGGVCADCGRSRDEHRRIHHGVDLHVHHLVPREWFYYQDNMTIDEHGNQLANLLTICCDHHKKWEQRQVGPEEIRLNLPSSF